ncbi:MAG: helix-turn-helix domain-containing protein [Nocardioides sp.]
MSREPARRGRRGTETRRNVEKAAGRLFTEQGYHATTLQQIADAAGVHVQTVYLAYGTKAEVLRAAAAWATSEEDPAIPPQERRWVREIVATDDPRLKLRLYVRHIRDITLTWGPFQQAMRAAIAEPEVGEKLAAMEEGRFQGPLNLWPAIEAHGQLRDGLSAERAAALTYAIASPDTFRQLLDRGLSLEEAEEEVTRLLILALLTD